MADENDKQPLEKEDLVVAPVTPGRSFAPLTEETIAVAAEKASVPSKTPEPGPPKGVPAARVNTDMVKEFEDEIEEKVTTGRRRMRWFANHLILFVAGVAGAIPLRLTVFSEYHDAFFLVPLALWVGLLAFHANFAIRQMLKRSDKESQIKAVVQLPESDDGQHEFDWEKP